MKTMIIFFKRFPQLISTYGDFTAFSKINEWKAVKNSTVQSKSDADIYTFRSWKK